MVRKIKGDPHRQCSQESRGEWPRGLLDRREQRGVGGKGALKAT